MVAWRCAFYVNHISTTFAVFLLLLLSVSIFAHHFLISIDQNFIHIVKTRKNIKREKKTKNNNRENWDRHNYWPSNLTISGSDHYSCGSFHLNECPEFRFNRVNHFCLLFLSPISFYSPPPLLSLSQLSPQIWIIAKRKEWPVDQMRFPRIHNCSLSKQSTCKELSIDDDHKSCEYLMVIY